MHITKCNATADTILIEYTIYQSPPSLQKATKKPMVVSALLLHFNPHLPRGRRLCNRPHYFPDCIISIPTFLAEGDRKLYALSYHVRHFNPHLPSGRRLRQPELCDRILRISIPTFLAEGDDLADWIGDYYYSFQSPPS